MRELRGTERVLVCACVRVWVCACVRVHDERVLVLDEPVCVRSSRRRHRDMEGYEEEDACMRTET